MHVLLHKYACFLSRGRSCCAIVVPNVDELAPNTYLVHVHANNLHVINMLYTKSYTNMHAFAFCTLSRGRSRPNTCTHTPVCPIACCTCTRTICTKSACFGPVFGHVNVQALVHPHYYNCHVVGLAMSMCVFRANVDELAPIVVT